MAGMRRLTSKITFPIFPWICNINSSKNRKWSCDLETCLSHVRLITATLDLTAKVCSLLHRAAT